MDVFISTFDAVPDGALMICRGQGVAYQRDMSSPVPYDEAYFDKYVGYEGGEIANRLNAGRVDFVNFHAGKAAMCVDIGIGSGEFIKSRPSTFGRDINPKAVAWLQQEKKLATALSRYEAFTFWDVIEHVEHPNEYFCQIPLGAYLFTSIPVFNDLSKIRLSKHYRPDEHFYYWTGYGFVSWMALYGFALLEQRDFESEAGREDILSFAFRRERAA